VNYGQGDISAALKLIGGIVISNQHQQSIHVNVTWILCTRDLNDDLPFYESFVQKALNLGIEVVVSDLSGIKIDESALSQADLLVYFPTISDIPIAIFTRVNKYKDKLLSIGEYNFDHHDKGVRIGLGEGRLGIFIEKNLAPPLPLILDQASASDKELLNQLALIDISTQTVTAEKIASYKQDHLLFFGYFALNLNQAINTDAVNPIKFCEIALHIAALKDVKNVDIIVRLGDDVVNLPNYFATMCSSIEVITSKRQFIIKNLNGNNNLPKARIFDSFPVSNDVFKLLMTTVAEKYFMGLTGDQSLTEGICCNAVIFLQIMSWKRHLAKALNQICHQTLPLDAQLLRFSSYVIESQDAGISTHKIAKFLVTNESQLLREMQHVQKAIEANFNLLENLVPRLLMALLAPSQVDKIFAGYQKESVLSFKPIIYSKINKYSVQAVSTLGYLSKPSLSMQEQSAMMKNIKDLKQALLFNKTNTNHTNIINILPKYDNIMYNYKY